MHFDRIGNRTGPAVVLIHGVPGSNESWSEVAGLLPKDCDIVVPHLLGFGASPRGGDLLADAQAGALREALASMGVDHATFVAHDFGAPIALTLYREAPELFDGIVILATNVFPDTPIPFPLNLVTLPLVGDAFARALFSGPALRQMVRRNGGSAIGDPTSVRTIFRTSLQHLAELYGEFAATMRSIDVPMTIVWGTEDPFFPLEQAHRTAALVPDAELVILEGAGHFLPEQHPARVAAAIQELSARASRRRSRGTS